MMRKLIAMNHSIPWVSLRVFLASQILRAERHP